MSARGKVIRIYLADGTPSGLRHAELGNWSGQALLVPRMLMRQAASWPEVQRPGVYFLLGPEAEGDKRQAYIGEAEVVWNRLDTHGQNKDFWEQAIVFTSKDENLTKAHVRYLEAVLIRAAQSAGRYKVENIQHGSLPLLPRGDRDMMDDYIDNLQVLLGALGHPVLEPILKRESGPTEMTTVPTFFYANAEASAKGVPSPDGFVVLKGSTALSRNQPSGSCRALKEQMIKSGALSRLPDKDLYEFVEDYLFGSSSAAANVISGTAVNGRIAWRSEAGTTLKEWEMSQLSTVSES